MSITFKTLSGFQTFIVIRTELLSQAVSAGRGHRVSPPTLSFRGNVFSEDLALRWWWYCHLHPPHSVQTALFHFHLLTLCFSATIKALWVCIVLEKGLWLSGSLWELCLIAACVVNYEVHFQRAVQIALWGTAASTRLRRNNTMLNNKSKAAHADCGNIFTRITEHVSLEEVNAATWEL